MALAFLLDDLSVVKRLLSTYPNLERSYLHVLPLASYLASTGLSSRVAEKSEEIRELAKLHTELEEDGRSLTALLRDQTRSIAIVGNSPCELGSGKGSFDRRARYGGPFSIAFWWRTNSRGTTDGNAQSM